MKSHYKIKDFDDQQLVELLRRFRSSVHRVKVNDAGLADEIENQLIKRQRPDLSEATLKKLARWCRTSGSPYQDGMPVAQRISMLLYGVIVDRELLHT